MPLTDDVIESLNLSKDYNGYTRQFTTNEGRLALRVVVSPKRRRCPQRISKHQYIMKGTTSGRMSSMSANFAMLYGMGRPTKLGDLNGI